MNNISELIEWATREAEKLDPLDSCGAVAERLWQIATALQDQQARIEELEESRDRLIKRTGDLTGQVDNLLREKADLEAGRGWISVDHPPKDGTYCLVANRDVSMIGLAFYHEKFMVEKDFSNKAKYGKVFYAEIYQYLPFTLPRSNRNERNR